MFSLEKVLLGRVREHMERGEHGSALLASPRSLISTNPVVKLHLSCQPSCEHVAILSSLVIPLFALVPLCLKDSQFLHNFWKESLFLFAKVAIFALCIA